MGPGTPLREVALAALDVAAPQTGAACVVSLPTYSFSSLALSPAMFERTREEDARSSAYAMFHSDGPAYSPSTMFRECLPE